MERTPWCFVVASSHPLFIYDFIKGMPMVFVAQMRRTLRLQSAYCILFFFWNKFNDNICSFSFFPTAAQPVINLLVTPIYKFSINIGLVKHYPIIPLNHSSSSSNDMRSLTMSISTPSDQQDNERRRAIALKALNERWKALNAGDQAKSQHLPKSFPQPGVSTKQQHSHHGHSHSERRVIPKFDIDELIKPIPLPPPPGMMPLTPTQSSSQSPTKPSTND